MDFVLGILTGIVSMLFLGVYLNERDKKRKSRVPKHRNPPPLPDRTEEYRRRIMSAYGLNPELPSTYISGTWFVGLTPDDMKFISHSDELIKPDYAALLRDAIKREDYETAARLRDLINKK